MGHYSVSGWELYCVSGLGTALCQWMGHCIMAVDGALYYVSGWGTAHVLSQLSNLCYI